MRKTFIQIFTVLLLGVVLLGCGNEKETKKDVLKVGMELAYPPFETKDTNGNPSGISVDFAKAFGEYIGKEVIIENIAWDGLIPSIQTGKVDMVVSSMTITEKRGEIVDFSTPYANSLLAMLTNTKSNIKSIEDLNHKDKVVAVKVGTSGFNYAKNNLTNATILTFPDESAAVTEVVQGKADAFLYDQLTIYRNWEKNKETTTAIFIPFQNTELWGVAVQKGNEKLLTELNEFIPKFIAEGGFDRLTEKYLPSEKAKFDEFGFKWFFDLN